MCTEQGDKEEERKIMMVIVIIIIIISNRGKTFFIGQASFLGRLLFNFLLLVISMNLGVDFKSLLFLFIFANKSTFYLLAAGKKRTFYLGAV
jgi:hypothetical protein